MTLVSETLMMSNSEDWQGRTWQTVPCWTESHFLKFLKSKIFHIQWGQSQIFRVLFSSVSVGNRTLKVLFPTETDEQDSILVSCLKQDTKIESCWSVFVGNRRYQDSKILARTSSSVKDFWLQEFQDMRFCSTRDCCYSLSFSVFCVGHLHTLSN